MPTLSYTGSQFVFRLAAESGKRSCSRGLAGRVTSHGPCFSASATASCLHTTSAATTTSEDQSPTSSSRSTTHVVDVSDLALKMRASVREYTASLHGTDRRPVKLLGILAHDGDNDDSYRHRQQTEDAAELYSQHIAETCREDGIDYELCRVLSDDDDDCCQPSDVEAAIQTGNARSDVDGLLVYYPIFKTRRIISHPHHYYDHNKYRGPYKNRLTGVYYKTFDDYLRDAVCYTKDVEGLCQEYNARWLFRARGMDRIRPQQDNTNNKVLYPCAALSVFRILEAYHCPTRCPPKSCWKGTIVTIVNRSEIFGRPLAAMLANAGATVYSVDIDSILLFRHGGRMRRCNDSTKTLETCLAKSSVVVTGVPSPNFVIPSEWISAGATVVNVSEYANVCEESLLEDVPGVQYVPHVGKVTIAVLEQNLIQLHRWYGNNQ